MSKGGYSGLYIEGRHFKPDTRYILSYKIEVISGDLSKVGGHTDATFSNNNLVVYYDDNKPINVGKYQSSADMRGRKNAYLKITFTTPSTVTNTHKIYIQPNRGIAGDTTTKISNIKIVEMTDSISITRDDKILASEFIEVGDLKGNRNLLSNSSFNKKPLTWGDAKVQVNNNVADVATGGKSSYGVITSYDDFFSAGNYTLSFEAKTDDVKVFDYCYVMSKSGNQGLSNINVKASKGFVKYSIPVILNVDKDRAGVMIGSRNGTSFKVKNIKLEKGDQSTKYSPSPKDMGIDTDIDKFGMYVGKRGVDDMYIVANEFKEV